ncbi:MAG: ABC transporter six-transmembrane domain-containing protein [Chloroherpetonaceae bacterium]|nr:ABC transporter six-transmembrane domain-containing protein [Chloroherpetonaceae bacterium]MCS7211442.1 ABC transporter six-transmembrane domain-containing protein [Chloroherpetonaceae bacterium]MDW8020017.1 ABC transporter six-transmembrane domain-containing protein [Chloroherpetonaceae bacterium]
MQIRDLLKRFKFGILAITTLVVVENLAWIVEPSIFGSVIDAFINTATEGGLLNWHERLIPLVIWISVYALNSSAGVLRRIIDQRIFWKMYVQIAADVSRISKLQGHNTSKIAARAQLSKEYITFLQYRLPEIIEQLLTIAGAVIALYLFDWRISLVCFAIVLPLLLVNRIYSRNVFFYQKELHDRFESIYDVFETKDIDFIRSYFQSTAKAHQKIANWGALNFGLMRFVLLAVFLVVLYISIDLDNFTTGDIYAIVAYLWTFVSSSEYLPDLLESWTSIREVSMRMKVSDEEMKAFMHTHSADATIPSSLTEVSNSDERLYHSSRAEGTGARQIS